MAQAGAFSVLEHVPELHDGVVPRTARDIVADKIAGLIASGILQIGDLLPSERDLAAALQVSRETVRGGLQNLAARRIIEVSQGARTRVVSADVGAFVMDFSETRRINSYDIEDVHAARLLVERPVVAAAAVRIGNEDIKLLEDSLAAQRAAMEDSVRFLICDREFHLTIYRSCGNPALADFVSKLYAYMMEYRRQAISQPGAILKSYNDHQAIVAALSMHDPEATVAAFYVHLDRIYTTTRTMLDRRQSSVCPSKN